MSSVDPAGVVLRYVARTAGDIMLYDQHNPANNEIKQPGRGVNYHAEGPSTYDMEPNDEEGSVYGGRMPSRQMDNAPSGSSRVIPDAMKQTLNENYVTAARRPGVSKWTAQKNLYRRVRDIEYGSAKVSRQVAREWRISYQTVSGEHQEVLVDGREERSGNVSLTVRRTANAVRVAARIVEIMGNCGPEIQDRSKGVQFRRTRILPEKGMITYAVQGSKGEVYKVRVKGVRRGNVKALAKMPVKVSCSCNYFRWQGPEHWAKSNGYLYGRPVGTASRPVEKDPKGKHWVCKHVYAILNAKKGLRFASGEWRFDGFHAPDYRNG
jgi:hypothetical protein